MSLLSIDIINFVLAEFPLLDEARPQYRLKGELIPAAYWTLVQVMIT
jgi:hypothetical protein